MNNKCKIKEKYGSIFAAEENIIVLDTTADLLCSSGLSKIFSTTYNLKPFNPAPVIGMIIPNHVLDQTFLHLLTRADNTKKLLSDPEHIIHSIGIAITALATFCKLHEIKDIAIPNLGFSERIPQQYLRLLLMRSFCDQQITINIYTLNAIKQTFNYINEFA